MFPCYLLPKFRAEGLWGLHLRGSQVPRAETMSLQGLVNSPDQCREETPPLWRPGTPPPAFAFLSLPGLGPSSPTPSRGSPSPAGQSEAKGLAGPSPGGDTPQGGYSFPLSTAGKSPGPAHRRGHVVGIKRRLPRLFSIPHRISVPLGPRPAGKCRPPEGLDGLLHTALRVPKPLTAELGFQWKTRRDVRTDRAPTRACPGGWGDQPGHPGCIVLVAPRWQGSGGDSGSHSSAAGLQVPMNEATGGGSGPKGQAPLSQTHGRQGF